MSAPVFRSIASTLIRSILRWAVACALLFATAQAVYSYVHVKQEFKDELQKIAATNVPLLSINLWDIEPDAIRRQIDNIAMRPQIGFVRLTAVTGQRFFAGDESLAGHSAEQGFNIPPPGRADGTLGSLEIYANPGAFYRELAMSVGIAIIGYLILTLLICAVSVYILKRHLAQPLHRIAAYASALEPQNLGTPLVLDRPAGQGRDEIDLVVEGFQMLQSAINGHIRNLDQLVVQRTHDLQAALGSIQRLSLIDPLTQCFNRRAFDTQIEQEFDRSERYGRPLSVVFGDIDHFKLINDTYGHLVGDQVLQATAACLRQGVRLDVDWIARFGGEEFVIVMPETDEQGAVVTTERLRLAVATNVVLPEQPALRVTASFGVAQHQKGESVHELVRRVDSLLYAAKRAGRNRTMPALHAEPSAPATLG